VPGKAVRRRKNRCKEMAAREEQSSEWVEKPSSVDRGAKRAKRPIGRSGFPGLEDL